MFARYSNVKAGKFAATEQDMMSDSYNEDEFENLNDVAKVLGKIGISIQEGNEFRNIEEVLTEIAEKWETLDGVEKNAVATALAGTRQREALYTALENWTKVTDLATVSANSFGSAEKKMEAYSDSLQASQNRVIASFEKWILALEGNEFLINFNNLLASLVENADTLILSLSSLFLIMNKNKVGNLLTQGLGFLGGKVLEKGVKKSTPKASTSLIDTLTNKSMEVLYISANRSLESVLTKQMSKQIISKDLATKIMDGFTAINDQNISKQLLNNSIWKNWLQTGTLNLDQTGMLQFKNQLMEMGLSANQAAKALDLMTTETNAATRKTIQTQQEILAGANGLKSVSTLALQGISSMVSPMAGGLLGGYWGNQLGGMPGAIVGSSLGGILMNTLSSSGVVGAGISLGVSLIGAVVTGIISHEQKVKEELEKAAVEAAAEAEKSYKSAITSTSQVERYNELVEGVDNLGRNVSLTEEEYEEFLEVSNDLAEIFPYLVQRTDEMGNSLLGMNGKVGEITESVEALTEAMQKNYNTSLLDPNYAGSSLEDAQEIIKESNKKIEENQKKIEEMLSKYQGLTSLSLPSIKEEDIVSTKEIVTNRRYGSNSNLKNGDVAINVGSKENVAEYKKLLDLIGVEEYNNRVLPGAESYIFINSDDLEEVLKAVNDAGKYNEDLNIDIETARANIKAGNEAILDAQNALEPIVSAQVQRAMGENTWNAYSEEYQQLFTKVGMSVDAFNENGKEKSADQYLEEIKKQTDKMQDLLVNPENVLTIETFFKISDSKTAEEVEAARKDFLNLLMQMISEGATIDEANKILIPWGFQYIPEEEESGKSDFNFENTSNIYDSGSVRSQLVEKGMSQEIADLLGETNVETLKYAYQELDESVLSSIDSVEKFYDVVNSEKLKNDDLSFLVSEYKRLSEMEITPGSAEEQYMNRLVERIRQYATAVGAAKDDWDEIWDKVQNMPDTTLIGTTTKTMEEVQEQYTDYRDFSNYLTGDEFDGANIDAEVYGRMMQYEDLLPHLVSGNVQGLLNELTNYLDSAEEHAKGTFEEMVANSEELSQQAYEQNVDLVEGLIDNYGIDLRTFGSANVAKKVANELLTGQIESAWNTMNSRLEELYEQDMITFSEYTAAKAANLQSLIGQLGIDVMSKEEWMASQGDIIWGDANSIDSGYNTYLDLTYKSANRKKQDEIIEWGKELGQAVSNVTTEILNNTGLGVKNVGGAPNSSDSGSGSEGPTQEDILDALKGTVNKEYEAMLAFDSKSGKGIRNSAYYDKMKNVLKAQLDNYNIMLKSAENEQERLDILSKIQNTEVEIANLDDEQKRDAMTIAELQNMSLEGRIKLQESMLATADTLEERLQMEQDLNSLIKERENLITAEGDLINKEYRDLLDFNGQKGNGNQYYIDRKANLEELLVFYEDFLKRDNISEEDRLAYEKKIQDTKLEIANLDDEEIENNLELLKTQEASLKTQIEMQKELVKASDTAAEQVERQKELNELLKEEYELRMSFNNFQIDQTQRIMDRTNPESEEYAELVKQQISNAENNVSITLEAIKRKAKELKQQYISEGKYSEEEIKELIISSEEVQSLYKNYIDSIDKKIQIMIDYAEARINQIDFQINQMEISKPQEWSGIDQIVSYSEKNIDLLEKKIPILEEILKNSANLTNEQIQNYTNQLNQVYKAIHDAKIQQQQDIVNYQEQIYSALTWQVQEYIEKINNQKEAIEDYYDTELDKLNKVNDAKERTIELEKLQDALLNARKEKQRVYRTGIGWVYESDRSAIKEAEQNLDDFYLDDKISDLNNTKEQELAVLDQRIENWNKYLEALQDAHDKYENSVKEHLLFELLNVESQEELYEKINQDMQNYIISYDKNVEEYGKTNVEYNGIFTEFLTEYGESVKKLDELQKEVIKIFEGLISGIGGSLGETLPNIVDDVGVDWSEVWWKAQRDYEAGIITEEEKNATQKWAHANKTEEMAGSGSIFNPGNGTWGSGSSSSNSSSGGSSGNKYQGSSSNGGPGYNIGSEKGQNFVDNAKPGEVMTGGDGSTWTKNPDGSTTITQGGNTWVVPKYENGIENGPVTTTGLAMLHGTISKPEYVLNNDQAWQLLKNFATIKAPEKISNFNSSKNDVFNINGNIILNDVKNPSQFWDKLMEATKNRFNVTKRNN